MKLAFTSVDPSQLVKGKVYLCGRGSLVDEIDWMFCQFDGKRFYVIGSTLVYFNPTEFMYCLDGYVKDYLIFDMPSSGLPDNGTGAVGDLYYRLLSVVSPLGETALLELPRENND